MRPRFYKFHKKKIFFIATKSHIKVGENLKMQKSEYDAAVWTHWAKTAAALIIQQRTE